MEPNIYDFEVNSRQSFVEFLRLLLLDYSKSPDEWENDNIGSFLEAMSRYADEIQGYYDNIGQDVDANLPSWKVFSDILRGAKIYE